jgi:hypothetical protein
MQDLSPSIEACTGLALWPTYSYARLYKHGDTLLPPVGAGHCRCAVILNVSPGPGLL